MSKDDPIPVYGRAVVSPAGDVVAGSYGTWRLTLTVGKHGIDDSGRILIARRMAANWGLPQFDRPAEAEYTTVTASGSAVLSARYDPRAYIRPWRGAVVIDVTDGALCPGDTVTVTFGDTCGGGPGSQSQTFRQERYEFRVLVDAHGTGQYVPLAQQPWVRIVGAEAARLRLRCPSEVTVGEEFAVAVVAEDRYGNPADGFTGRVDLWAEGGEQPLATHRYAPAERGAHRFEGLHLAAPGNYRLQARESTGALEAVGNPIVCHAAPPEQRLFWGDIHGQTGATVGTGTVEEYFTFGRQVAALDFIAHCANDFQITEEHWQETQEGVRRHHDPGRYVTFLAYEWSGTTPVGGDHNVYFRGDQGVLHRSSHWQIADRSDEASDRSPLSELQRQLSGRDDVMLLPHVGGRHANLDFLDPKLTPFIEIASVHGVFEWFAHEALRRGLRVGFVANSDDHSGRPGATYPSGSDIHFGMRGGLLAAYATELTRESLWEAFFARRCYGTTGERIVLRFSADGLPMGSELRRAGAPELAAEVLGTAPLETVEVLRGAEVVYRHPLAKVLPGERPLLKLTWEGARTRYRRRPTIWHGSLRLSAGRILDVAEFAIDQPHEGIVSRSDRELTWLSSTAGDPDGLFLDIDAPPEAVLQFEAGPARFGFRLGDLRERLVIEAGGEGQRVTAEWVRRGERPLETRFTFRDPAPPDDDCAYWLRVIQRDGAMAWSSPVFVTRER